MLFGKRRLEQYLGNKLVTRMYLRADLAREGGVYLPQPLYRKEIPVTRKYSESLSRVGFSGYWGYGKGVETLIEAWRNKELNKFQLVIAGAAAFAHDSYSIALRQRIRREVPSAEVPGMIPDQMLEQFITGLDLLILPYWPGLPNGTSAMALRAAELGTPIIASDLPALRQELGENGAIYIEPKDPLALTKAILRAHAQWPLMQVRARNLQISLQEEHGWSTVGQRLTDIIQQISS